MVVYIVLGILYESYIHPLTILSGLPSAGFGALVTLILFGMELNIYAFVGMIMLIGIVKKNAIMQIDFALEAERQRQDAGAGHLRGLPDPVPADHDDDDGGAARRGADRARLRRRRRSAAAARAGGRRRPAVLAAGHALSDAGRLHLHGAAAGLAEDPPVGRRERTGGVSAVVALSTRRDRHAPKCRGNYGLTLPRQMQLTSTGLRPRDHLAATPRLLPALALALEAAALGLTFVLDRLTDSAPVQHLDDLPIIFGAVRFGRLGALSTSLCAIVLYHLANPHLLTFRYEQSDLVQIALFIGIGWITAKLRADAQRFRSLAMTDDLTGLHNLRLFETHLGQMIRTSRQAQPLALLVLDLDRLKSLDD